ncbi:Aminotransferase-like, plant mobile domain, partial [Dillenia turbinata]
MEETQIQIDCHWKATVPSPKYEFENFFYTKLISPKEGKPITRIARFLNPCTAIVSQAVVVPNAPLLFEIFPESLQQWKSRVCFKGWKNPSRLSRSTIRKLWASERFSNLGPNSNALKPGEPRVARYHKLRWNLTLPHVRLSLKSPTDFLWRSYAVNLTNWRHLAYHNESEEKELDFDLGLDEDLQSYIVSELVGVDCKESYFPHRVAMQFGPDQDLPSEASDAHFDMGNGKIFIPARSFEPGVSTRYLNWWKEMMLARHDKIENHLVHDGVVDAKVSPLITKEKNVEDCHASGASGSDVDELTISMVASKSRNRKTCADFCNQFHLIDLTQEIVVLDDEMNEFANRAVESKGRNAKEYMCTTMDTEWVERVVKGATKCKGRQIGASISS